MSATGEILRTYRAPRAVIRRLLGALSGDDRPEARLLVYLLAGCFIIFVGQVPGLLALPVVAPDAPPREAILGITFFGWLFVWPLLFYGLAALAHLAARAFGGRGDTRGSRAALFWTVLAVSPLMLLRGLVETGFGPGPALMAADFVVGVAFCALWVISLVEAEREPAR
ncbi:YIP1 family protein [Tropicimonas sp. IMCC6043]|uniref:YIP1 family protein n=1 Tax=Tropicimonas sp. IMCC6043 TaxID=2510645 RepID=UPI00101D5D0E|nr:YIP1 family protein [Tropicimonas sp. IMCC6043]RYH10518.1 YIP1 family protein [Tropicimonas sp. IMCC6043]